MKHIWSQELGGNKHSSPGGGDLAQNIEQLLIETSKLESLEN